MAKRKAPTLCCPQSVFEFLCVVNEEKFDKLLTPSCSIAACCQSVISLIDCDFF